MQIKRNILVGPELLLTEERIKQLDETVTDEQFEWLEQRGLLDNWKTYEENRRDFVPYSESDACWCQPFTDHVHPRCPMHGTSTAKVGRIIEYIAEQRRTAPDQEQDGPIFTGLSMAESILDEAQLETQDDDEGDDSDDPTSVFYEGHRADVEAVDRAIRSERSPKGWDSVQGGARPDDAPAEQIATIDITPESLKTAAGAEKVAKALDEWNGSAHEVANALQHWLDEFGADVQQVLKLRGDFPAALEDLHQITALVGARSRKQDAFLKAVAGR